MIFQQTLNVPRARVAQWVRQLDQLTTHTSLSPIRRGFAPSFVNYKKEYTRLAAASDKVYQLLAHGRWFSPGTPASSSTKTGRHAIAEILLKVALNIKNKKKSILNVPTEKPRLLAPWYIDLSQSSVNFSYYNLFFLINLSIYQRNHT